MKYLKNELIIFTIGIQSNYTIRLLARSLKDWESKFIENDFKEQNTSTSIAGYIEYLKAQGLIEELRYNDYYSHNYMGFI